MSGEWHTCLQHETVWQEGDSDECPSCRLDLIRQMNHTAYDWTKTRFPEGSEL